MPRLNRALLVIGLTAIGCTEQPKPAPEVPVPVAKSFDVKIVPGTSSSPAKTEPYEATVGGFKFMVPADWQEQPAKSQFVLGEFSLTGEGGRARLTLSSAGGGLEANVERWQGQFSRGPNDSEPRQSEITFDGQKGTLVELSGTYADMLSGGSPSKNWQMLGVAVPLGPTNFFVKLTGPQATVTAQREAFVKFVESAKADK
jgi:hypothetical protein